MSDCCFMSNELFSGRKQVTFNDSDDICFVLVHANMLIFIFIISAVSLKQQFASRQ